MPGTARNAQPRVLSSESTMSDTLATEKVIATRNKLGNSCAIVDIGRDISIEKRSLKKAVDQRCVFM